MTIADRLTKIAEIKEDIRLAVNEQGVILQSDKRFDEYPDAIRAIAGGNGSGDGGSPENVYSTEETRIGTWIDGKPVYRRVVSATTPTNQEVWTMSAADWGIEVVVGLHGGMQVPDLKVMIPLSYYVEPTNFATTWFDSDWVLSVHAPWFLKNRGGCPMHIIAEYTKTTDKGDTT